MYQGGGPIGRVQHIKDSSIRVTISVFALLFILLISAATHILYSEHRNSVLQAKEKANNVLGAVFEHANWIVQASKQALLRIDAAIPDPTNRDTWLVNDLRPLSAGLPPGARVFIVRSDGISMPTRAGEKAIDLSDRDYFQNLKKGTTWFVGRQIVTKVQQDTVFTVVRRLVRDGEFAGIVGIAIPADLMTRFYENLEFGNQSRVWLTTLDGWIVAGAPRVEGSNSVADFPAWNEISAFPAYTGEIDASAYDGNSYYLASRKLESAPLIATIALSKDDVAHENYTRQQSVAIASGLGMLLLVALSLWVISLQRKDFRARVDLATALLQKAESETNMRLALEAGHMGHWQIDPPHWNVTFSKQIASLIGLGSEEAVLSVEESMEYIYRDDRPRLSAALKQTMELGKPLNVEYRVVSKNGKKFWLASLGDILRDEKGRMISIVGVTMDITERRQSEDRQRLMIAELDHRVKNTLATVQSLARQGLPKTDTTHAFVGRIGSLANAHSLLAESKWKGTSLKTLVTRQLGAHLASHQITFQGPDLLLKPKTTQTLSMVLHELTTNAMKYGALSSQGASLALDWSVSKSPENLPRFVLEWREDNIAPTGASQHKGFGSRLIEQSVKYELGGNVETHLLPHRFQCIINVPLEEVEMVDREAAPLSEGVEIFQSEAPGSVTGRKILLVEDTAFIAMDMESLLLDKGAAEIIPAFRLEEAVQKARHGDFDFALLDVNLDGKMVFPVAEILLERGIPFLFLSGYGEEADWPEKWIGATRLAKPVQDRDLFGAIGQLRLHQQTNRLEAIG